MLDTITPKHVNLQQISIHMLPTFCRVSAKCYPSVERRIDKALPGMHRKDLDRLLVKLWEFYSIRTRIWSYQPLMQDGGRDMRDWAKYMFPMSLSGGNADFAEICCE